MNGRRASLIALGVLARVRVVVGVTAAPQAQTAGAASKHIGSRARVGERIGRRHP
jgi:hypothetical protein